MTDLVIGRVGVIVEQLFCHQHETRRAEAALERAGLNKGLLHRIEPAVASEVLDGQNLGAIGERCEVKTTRHGVAVDQHGAAAAQSLPAALACAEQVELLAQQLDQAQMRREGCLDGAAVECEADRTDAHRNLKGLEDQPAPFETPASRAPQGEQFLYMPSKNYLILRS